MNRNMSLLQLLHFLRKSEVTQTFRYSFLTVHSYLDVGKGQKELKRSTSAADLINCTKLERKKEKEILNLTSLLLAMISALSICKQGSHCATLGNINMHGHSKEVPCDAGSKVNISL